MEEKISVIICTKNRPDALGVCLDSILANTLLPFEILVIDQSEFPDSKEIVRKLGGRTLPVIHMENHLRGVSSSKNLGIKYSHGNIIAFTDDDCIASKNWIKNAVKEFSMNQKIHCIVGRVLHQSTMDESMVSEDGMEGQLFHDRVNPWEIGPSGGNLFIRKTVFDKIGIFDPLFGPGEIFKSAEDADIIYRIFKAKIVIKFSPSVVIAHNRPRSGEANDERIFHYGTGLGAFALKHVSFNDLLPLRIFLIRFLTELIRTLTGALLLKKEMAKTGYLWVKGFTHGFQLFLKERRK